jgi:hypothetical protein
MFHNTGDDMLCFSLHAPFQQTQKSHGGGLFWSSISHCGRAVLFGTIGKEPFLLCSRLSALGSLLSVPRCSALSFLSEAYNALLVVRRSVVWPSRPPSFKYCPSLHWVLVWTVHELLFMPFSNRNSDMETLNRKIDGNTHTTHNICSLRHVRVG